MQTLVRNLRTMRSTEHPVAYAALAHKEFVCIHPFVDGNKRSGAYAFIWFLNHAKILDVTRISPPALTAITLLIAESSPKDKEKMIFSAKYIAI